MRSAVCALAVQMLHFADRTGRHHMMALDRFADHSSKDAWDYSAWVRVYSMYLNERLDVYRCAAAISCKGWSQHSSTSTCGVVSCMSCMGLQRLGAGVLHVLE
jgi:hypothetical protein